jgi:hypothetical protein
MGVTKPEGNGKLILCFWASRFWQLELGPRDGLKCMPGTYGASLNQLATRRREGELWGTTVATGTGEDRGHTDDLKRVMKVRKEKIRNRRARKRS